MASKDGKTYPDRRNIDINDSTWHKVSELAFWDNKTKKAVVTEALDFYHEYKKAKRENLMEEARHLAK